MARAGRLLELIALLRRYKYPVTGSALAQELDISLRTLYRDIDTLRAIGAPIEGEAGLGYVLNPGFLLPPLMFTADELQALALGTEWVAERGDADLAEAAFSALHKIHAALPERLSVQTQERLVMAGPSDALLPKHLSGNILRNAMRQQNILVIDYTDKNNAETKRRVWPIVLAYFEAALVLVAWCETRVAFRHFRLDRIAKMIVTDERYKERRSSLYRRWRSEEGID